MRLSLLITFLLASIGLFSQSEKELLYEEARSYLDARDYQLALSVLDELTSKYPDFDTAWVEKGFAYLGLDQPAQAIISTMQAVEIDSANMGAYFVRGIAHNAMFNYEAALLDYNYIVLTGDNDYYYLALKERGILFIYFEIADKAIDDFMEYYEHDPTDIDVLLAIGTLQAEKRNNKEALEFYNEALSLDANNVDALHKRTLLYIELEHYNRALDDISKAIILAAKMSELYITRASVYMALGNSDYALVDLDYAIVLNPNNVIAYLDRARIKESLNDKKGAKADYQKAEKLGYGK